MSGLSELIAKLEGLSGPDRSADIDIALLLIDARREPNWYMWQASRPKGAPEWSAEEFWQSRGRCPAFTASLDAAVALVERKLPGAKVIACTATKFTNGTYQADYAIKYDGDPASLNDMKVAWGAKAEGPDLASTMARACILALLRSLEGRDE